MDSDGNMTCPICLSVPTAAKMTRCGHIYCWPCILHYLALSDKAWRKCPICYESVYKDSLKSVTVVTKESKKESEVITFKLMKRSKASCHAVPSELFCEPEEPATFNDVNLSRWSKIVTCSHGDVFENILNREQRELESCLGNADDEPEKIFVQEAIEELNKRRQALELKKPAATAIPQSVPSTPRLDEGDSMEVAGLKSGAISDRVYSYNDAFNDSINDEEGDVAKDLDHWSSETMIPIFDDDTAKEASNEQPPIHHSVSMPAAVPRGPKNDPRFYYFYQADDGQRVFLHPLNVRMLLSEYGSWNDVPLTVSGKVVELEQLTMDEEVRSRFGPLGHLSLTTQFAFCEIRFDKGFISKATLGSFHEALHRRKRTRQRRVADERRQDAKAERWHKAMMIQSRGVIIPGGMSNLDNVDLEMPSDTVVPSAQAEVEAAAAGASSASPPGQDFSFAQMLRYGVSRRRDHLPSAAAATRLEVPSEQAAARDFGADGDELKAPRHQEDFGSFLAAALDNMKVEGPKLKKGKKQKKREKVVFEL